jgi:hypothetical protein
MTPEFQVKTTPDLQPEEVRALTRLFEVVFSKPCPEDLFERKYRPRSIHSLMFLDRELIGAFSAIPVRYTFFGRTLLFAVTADLMIDPRHRGQLPRVQRLAEGLYAALAAEGVAFVFCCVRDQIFQLHRAISNWRAIGKIHYYAAPFQLPYRLAARTWNRLSPWSSEPRDLPFAIEKINDSAFAAWRYGIFPTNYTTVDLPCGAAIYATKLYYPITGLPPRLRPGILIDVFPLTKTNFDAAVQSIRHLEPDLNVLAYQGNLPFQARDMIRIPPKYERQPWTLAGRILNPDEVDQRIFDISHWNINLSNGDLI